ncbi:hypothetical protein BDW75DRAFT_224086 [Aspergillus navahoensis]
MIPYAPLVFGPKFSSHPLDLEIHARPTQWLKTLVPPSQWLPDQKEMPPSTLQKTRRRSGHCTGTDAGLSRILTSQEPRSWRPEKAAGWWTSV